MNLYKVFNKDLKCMMMQYVENKWNVHEGELILCYSGLHCCESIVECFSYGYSVPSKVSPTRVFIVESGAEFVVSNTVETKRCCRKLFLKKELSWNEIEDTIINEIKTGKAEIVDVELMILGNSNPKLVLRLLDEVILAYPNKIGGLDSFFFIGQLNKIFRHRMGRTILRSSIADHINDRLVKLHDIERYENTKIMLRDIAHSIGHDWVKEGVLE